MCEISKNDRRSYRDQDPPRIIDGNKKEKDNNDDDKSNVSDEPTLEFFRKQQQQEQKQDSNHHEQQQQQQQHELKSREEEALITTNENRDSSSSSSSTLVSNERENNKTGACDTKILVVPQYAQTIKVPSSSIIIIKPATSSSSSSCKNTKEVITNGVKRSPESCETLTNGKDMAPVMGVPPPPPPEPHMGPDGIILPRKPYNPCLISNNHKDLRRELLFNQKVGKNVLNQKSELQRALERRQRESALRRESQKNREETYKDDPRTALQRALEQRAKQLELSENPKNVEPPPNPLVTARAKLRTRTDSQ